MFHSANLCDKCDAPTANPENDYGEFICDDCEQNAAEAAWERHCASFHDGGDTSWPDAERVRMEAARRLK